MLFSGQTSSATSTAHQLGRSSAMLYVWGTWDGASIDVQISPDNTNWISDADRTFTASSSRNLHVCPVPTAYFRAVLASAGTATDLNCRIDD
jgi:hypothetical protein